MILSAGSPFSFFLPSLSGMSYLSPGGKKQIIENTMDSFFFFSEDILFELEATLMGGFLFKGRDCVTGGR